MTHHAMQGADRRAFLASVVYISMIQGKLELLPQQPTVRERTANKINIMGDRSPKSVKKQTDQKQAKMNAANQKKKEAVAAKQVAGKKK